MAAKDKRTQIYLTEEQHTAASEQARKKGATMASVVREALADYLARQECEPQVDWKGDAAFELIGTLDLPPLPESLELNEAIDSSSYDEV